MLLLVPQLAKLANHDAASSATTSATTSAASTTSPPHHSTAARAARFLLLRLLSMWEDRYAGDPVAKMAAKGKTVQKKELVLQRGQVLEHTRTEFCGEVVGANHAFVTLRDFSGLTRDFSLQDSFIYEEELVAPVLPKKIAGPTRTASGGFAQTAPQRAQVAKASRIFVEGLHDAELIEAVWGDDLREAAIVVEVLDGADNLAAVLKDFCPTATRKAGILLDHLVAGSKESKLAKAAVPESWRDYVLITGHPFVDVWQAVKPARLGLSSWPEISRSVEWKRGILEHLGLPHYEQADIAAGWQRILSRVRDYRDLEPQLVGPVEHLIDFVTA